MFGKRKKNKVKGKGKEKTTSFEKEVDILNYTPLDYAYTKRWAEYSNPEIFDSVHRKKIKNLAVDDLCGNMYTPEIKSEANKMKESAAEQRIHHYSLIDHHKGMVEGEIQKLEQLLLNYENDLKYVNDKLNELESLSKKGATV